MTKKNNCVIMIAMLIFPFISILLVALYITFNSATLNKGKILWSVALGFLAFLPIFIILSAFEGNGLTIDWSNSLSIAIFYLISDFILPSSLIIIAHHLLSRYQIIEQSVASSTFFYLSFFNALIVTTIASYHHYFGLYELVVLPILYSTLSLLIATFTSNNLKNKFGLGLCVLLPFCTMSAITAFFFATNHNLYGLMIFAITLLLFMMIHLRSKAKNSLG